ncbi:rubrerythrin family protein, partial [bacterium]
MRQLEAFQREEKTEYIIYSFLARRVKGKNGEVLKKIALDELKHYEFWRKYTG